MCLATEVDCGCPELEEAMMIYNGKMEEFEKTMNDDDDIAKIKTTVLETCTSVSATTPIDITRPLGLMSGRTASLMMASGAEEHDQDSIKASPPPKPDLGGRRRRWAQRRDGQAILELLSDEAQRQRCDQERDATTLSSSAAGSFPKENLPTAVECQTVNQSIFGPHLKDHAPAAAEYGITARWFDQDLSLIHI